MPMTDQPDPSGNEEMREFSKAINQFSKKYNCSTADALLQYMIFSFETLRQMDFENTAFTIKSFKSYIDGDMTTEEFSTVMQVCRTQYYQTFLQKSGAVRVH